MKFMAIGWKTRDNMSPKEIRAKLKADFDVVVTPSTLASWYTDENVKKFNMATDRIMVPDVRHNPKQRPDILVDMEQILSRKCDEVARTGVPYIHSVIRLLALHIFHKLLASNLYDSQGQRNEQHMVLDEEDTNNDSEFRFTASPGWLKNFMERCNVAFLKMKGEKGSADYDAVDVRSSCSDSE